MPDPDGQFIILNTRLRGHEGLWRVVIRDDKFASITAMDDSSRSTDAERDSNNNNTSYNAEGRLLVPQFCENHIHLDYAYTAGEPRVNVSGTLFEAIEIWQERKDLNLNIDVDIKRKAEEAARSCAKHGVGYIRSHVDVTDPNLTALKALLEVKERIKGWCELQIVAFPQNGIIATNGGAELMTKAMGMGADIVGGIPHIEPSYEDGLSSLRFIFDLATAQNAMIDIHCDEIDDGQSRFIDFIAAETTKRKLQGRVTVSHAVAMAYYPPGYLARLMPKLKEAGVGFAIAPRENLQLQGRDFNTSVPRGIAPVRTIVDCCIRVAFCQDSICDPWYPIGDGNPLRNLDTGLHVAHMLSARYIKNCLDFVTTHPATNMALQTSYGIEQGKSASCIILDAGSDEEVLRLQPGVLLSIHKGKEVFRRDVPVYQWSQ